MDLKTKHDLQEWARSIQAELRGFCNTLENALYSLEGQTFGKLTVLRRVDKIKLSGYEYAVTPAYECACECGQVVHATQDELLNRYETACVDCESE